MIGRGFLQRAARMNASSWALSPIDGGLACPEGIEPPTTRLEGECSIQLSYGQKQAILTAFAGASVRGPAGRSHRRRFTDPDPQRADETLGKSVLHAGVAGEIQAHVRVG